MGTKKIETALETYAVLRKQAQAYEVSYAADHEELMQRIDPDLREALTLLEALRTSTIAKLEAQIAEVVDQIKRAVPAIGHSVKGTTMQAVYTPGRPIWNDAMLQGYAMDHPEILAARSVSEPSVSLRPIKKGD